MSTCYRLSTSTAVGKWENVATKSKVRTLKIPLEMNLKQKKIINEWINTSNYVYNNALEKIKSGIYPNFYNLRNLLVTDDTKTTSEEYLYYENELKRLCKEKRPLEEITELKAEKKQRLKTVNKVKNDILEEWELNTPKDIRASAVKKCCNAYKENLDKFRKGQIKHFEMKFKKKTTPKQSISLPTSSIKIENNKIIIFSTYLGKEGFEISKKTLKKNKNITINHECELLKQYNKYWLAIPVDIKPAREIKEYSQKYCGIDPGVRTFLTVFSNNCIREYNYKRSLIKKLNSQIDSLKEKRLSKKFSEENAVMRSQKRIRKKAFLKREDNKVNLINELHWKSIRNVLSKYDTIFYGDIKSHDITKHGYNKSLNRDFNDLKFYKFKTRLLYMAGRYNKKVILVNEAYTSQTCSSCGHIYKIGILDTYNCSNCKKIMGRDINAAKNILMKGLLN